jgi:hypothetical protein
MAEATRTATAAYDGEGVQDAAPADTAVVSKEATPEARAINTTNVSSIFWAMNNSWRSRGTWQANFRFTAPVIVNAGSQVAVSVCERDANSVPFLGDARMSVLNVVPRNDGSVDVRWHVDWPEQLPVRLNFIIVN